ncbi:glycosyltransferase family 2 protein [Algoriphagus marincola]|uniref:glycosyltransferase family 2 protein n=1 Tax=Algoriphagus marincola TaxID=264027 RepID=UPI0004260C2C|nr:glycosyltransferase family 2 protein [Algoriphagus marincola]
MINPVFSIIICTHNREKLLFSCLSSLVENRFNEVDFEILVIDNGSKDRSKEIVVLFEAKLNISYFYEPRIGLSIARNRGIYEAKADWVVFLDDDSKVSSNFLQRFYFLISNFRFAGIGGRFLPWWSLGLVPWIPKSVVESPLLRLDVGPISNNVAVPGGICAFSKQWLKNVGLFPEEIGMRGDVVGYGEENVVQDRIRQSGGEIWFDPYWKIYHYVAPYKYHIKWHIKRMIGKGRDFQIRHGRLDLHKKLFFIVRGVSVGIIYGLRNFFPLLTQRGFYWQNWVLKSFSHSLFLIGRVLA